MRGSKKSVFAYTGLIFCALRVYNIVKDRQSMIKFDGKEILIKKSPSVRGMRLTVDKDGNVVVILNARRTFVEREVEDFVNKHSRFLRNNIKRAAVELPKFVDMGRVSLLGDEYLVIRDSNIGRFEISGDILYVPEKWRRAEAFDFFGNLLLRYIEPLTRDYSERYGLVCSRVKLSSGVSTWGTYYHTDHSVRYNICLVFLPKGCSEYLVAHELCHYLQANHSKRFWAEVKRVFPDYEKYRKTVKLYTKNSIRAMLELLDGQN